MEVAELDPGKGILGGGNSSCGGPEVGMNLARVRNKNSYVLGILSGQKCGGVAYVGPCSQCTGLDFV